MLCTYLPAASQVEPGALPGDSVSVATDSIQAQSDSLIAQDDSTVVVPEARTRSPHRQRTVPSHVVLTRDSLSVMEYHHAGEVLTHIAGIREFSLGNYGQPMWLGRMGSGQTQWSLSMNGSPTADVLTNTGNPYAIPIEDMSEVRVYSQYEAFWTGGPGVVLSADFVEKEWDAPRPVTRLRHTEAANEYLYTDGMFTLNTSETENLFIGGTRTVIGSSSSNNAARFANNRHESWNLRLRYRKAFGEAVSTRLALRYDDDITLLNGGVAPELDAAFTPLSYPLDGSEPFTTDAFDPKSALLVNPTMHTHRQRYTAELVGRVQWDRDSAHVTELRVRGESELRRFRDQLQDVVLDSLAEGYLNLTDTWSRFSLELHHINDLEWATLTLAGSASPYTADRGRGMVPRSGMNTMLRGKLDLTLAGIHLSGMARLDRAFGRSAFSAGAGGDLQFGEGLALWGGISYSPRIYSLTEQWYRSDGASALSSDVPLEDLRIAELGLRAKLDWLQADVRIFQRQSESRLALLTTPVVDTVFGRYALDFIEQGVSVSTPGISADLRLSVWRFHLDQQATALFAENDAGDVPTLLAPDQSYRAELYYRGSLIEGTLDLRVGASFDYCSAYLPLSWHPATGLFTQGVSDGSWSYTDMWRVDAFLFATIKDRATIHVVLHNAFDTNYISTAFYPMYDRALRVGVDWVFLD